jgi:hypothetical protein
MALLMERSAQLISSANNNRSFASAHAAAQIRNNGFSP